VPPKSNVDVEKSAVRILALNPYHGGSHRAFLDGWVRQSRHAFDVLTLPAYKWKWRMRHAAVTFAEEVPRCGVDDWEVLLTTDMLNLAEFLGLCPAAQHLPTVVYFHENQLTYPNQRDDGERDLHFAFTNLTAALAADRVWFNSLFHREEFLAAVTDWMKRMPDYALTDAAVKIQAKSEVFPPGIELPRCRPPAAITNRPLAIAWVARWEHDKDPETFFAALQLLREHGCDFRLNVLGESFGQTPDCFARAKRELSAHIDRWGYRPNRADYFEALAESDVVVSTAKHEFFGIGMVEAVAAGCFPLAPRRLAYPEVLGDNEAFFHDGTPTGIADRLVMLDKQRATERSLYDAERAKRCAERFGWEVVSARMDDAIEQLVGNSRER
jgi:glycosyltransferase involved in cell wall biosynthesis